MILAVPHLVMVLVPPLAVPPDHGPGAPLAGRAPLLVVLVPPLYQKIFPRGTTFLKKSYGWVGYKFLKTDGKLHVSVIFHQFSKTYN